MSDFNLYGTDLFGNPTSEQRGCKLADDFIVPPFSVLSARDGDWQERKRRWISLGIESEVGRGMCRPHGKDTRPIGEGGIGDYSGGDCWKGGGKGVARTFGQDLMRGEHVLGEIGTQSEQTGTSIFDPVICELSYRWYMPTSGQVVDPFAGGSVRGIVAALLGYRYWGADLRPEQVQANREQAREICPEDELQEVKVSGPMLRQMFHPCESNYISGTCHGRCCEGSDGIMVTIHPSEQARVEALGATVKDGFIVADSRGLCPFKTDQGFCGIHGPDKPFGCKASPFTLNKTDLLVVRNRYRLLRCYNCEASMPAYKAHRWSLEQIFGTEEAGRITGLAEAGKDQIAARMPTQNYQILHDNDAAKHGEPRQQSGARLEWVCGDAMEVLQGSPPADFIFSCPPYGDLERYSDDPRDLSTMEYHTFIGAYRRIIMRACERLKPNRFACFVVGDSRDPKTGHYRNFVSDTIESFRQCGLGLYNEAILVTAVGSLPIRVGKQFTAGRKLGKTHQNILTFIKGDWRAAAKACGPLRQEYELL